MWDQKTKHNCNRIRLLRSRGQISIKKEEGGLDRNELKAPITPDDPRFTELSGSGDAKISQNSEPETDLVSVSDPFDRPGYTPAWLSRV